MGSSALFVHIAYSISVLNACVYTTSIAIYFHLGDTIPFAAVAPLSHIIVSAYKMHCHRNKQTQTVRTQPTLNIPVPGFKFHKYKHTHMEYRLKFLFLFYFYFYLK